MNDAIARQKSGGHSIFWRLLLRSVQVKRPQTALALGSLVIGAAVCSLLLNLYGGVQRKMTDSFRSFGPNVILAPRASSSETGSLAGLMDEPPLERLQTLQPVLARVAAAPVLYAVMRVKSVPAGPRTSGGQDILAVGSDFAALARLNPGWHLEGRANAGPSECAVGSRLASALGLGLGKALEIDSIHAASSKHASAVFHVAAIVSTGSSEDSRVFIPLEELQRLAGTEGKVSAVEMHVSGSAQQIEAEAKQLAALFPDVEVRPVRQIVYSEGKVLGTIRHLTMALTALILVIIALCVAATMTAIVLERRKDVAVMKALGAEERSVMELFVTEGAVLGAAGGLAG